MNLPFATHASASQSPLRAALRASRGALLFAAFFSIGINFLMLVPPLYMMQVYDRVLSSRSEATLITLTVITLGAFLAMGILEVVRSRILVRVSGRLDSILTPLVFENVFRNHVRATGSSRTQPLGDVAMVRQFVAGPGLFAFFDLPFAPIFLGLLFLMHPLLGFLSLGGSVILVLLALASEWTSRQRLAEATRHNVAATNFAETSLRNGDAMTAMGMLGAVKRRWMARHERMLQMQAQASDWAGTLSNATKVVRIALQSLMLGAGALLAIEGKISPGLMIAASIIGSKSLAPIEALIANWGGMVAAQQAWRRLGALLRAGDDEIQPMSLPAPKGQLDVEALVAAPPGAAAAVLRGVSFSLRPGEALGIVGASGSGKSTLARVVTGVWPAAAGTVRIDGAELGQWSREQLGPYIGYLPQDVDLFDGTIAENIARLGEVDAAAVVAAARMAGIHELILSFPQGYDTLIGESGNRLSGGQRQRVGLARALYGQPTLCVFDEPNSNLDDAGEAQLIEVLQHLRQRQTTTLVIAHRPSILQYVDKIMILQAGQVVFLGPRAEAFARFARPVVAPTVAQVGAAVG
ncbi:type I secretion system permease/ATPase [Roseococcus sp. SDR]|uniref:type I secretion system permease/ATPase n=1 Tax=Roseococcus sp. SDR TaxID=2835532 RepID=UPI001BCAB648|nr:type I secretion system permease/ATPase [Roseococcus sp. SDR]MBS7793013.1 type I secretion system permease/ATPase [Roseococcus sp. SDR]MBV1848327.1 type I secretion system permease/ATPase [Roseococcus sp. SDR]